MKYAITTLGCKVNSYESDVIRDLLNKKGYEEVSFNDVSDIYIINTCTVTNTADSKSLKLIRQAINKKEDSIVIAVGCLVQADPEAVNNISGVDIIIGNQNKTKIVEYIETFKKNKTRIFDIADICEVTFEKMQIDNSSKTRAFVKVQDGCNNFCSYCIIPYVRGNVRSKNMDEVIEEINTLTSDNHKEIVLTGIHTGAYGSDKDYTFTELVKKILENQTLKRLRISSIEATEIDEELLELIKNNSILVDHMHIPIQSGSNKILKLMDRKYDVNEFKNIINKLKKVRENIIITTDLIVGFPGETEEDFNETLETLKEINFHKIHVFPYSKRSGTKAATFNDQIDGLTKKDRVKKALKLSNSLEAISLNNMIGKKLSIIAETKKENTLIGHASNYVLIKTEGEEKELGNEIDVIIEKVDFPYLIGKRI